MTAHISATKARATTKGPFKAEDRGGYWLLVDTRNGEPASYPTTKRQCASEATQMNRLYAECIAEGGEA